MTFSNVKIEPIEESDEFYLTGTLKYSGKTALNSIEFRLGCTEVKLDKYNEEVRSEANGSFVTKGITYNCPSWVFAAVQPGETRPFKYLVSYSKSNVKLEDPNIVIKEIDSTTDATKASVYAKEGDFTVTFPSAGDGKSFAVLKNNTAKLCDVECEYVEKDEDGYFHIKSESQKKLRPDGEYLFMSSLNNPCELVCIKYTENTESPAVSLDKEFSFTESIDSNGNPVLKLTNKTGKYLSLVTIYDARTREYDINKDKVLREQKTTSAKNMKPNEEREIQLVKSDDDVLSFKVYDIQYKIDKEKEASKASESSASTKTN